ncbi:MAG TPA: 2-dehydro-3-deoxy-6-phosphogalactonate aldolase [Deltaproteobacteria bacterium]|nr:2-dehydro-3-deoxy-6-phosphogalactonate aldolase [Deltaproteobacteria bacterium]HCP44969.1 2-dehydro-3-deoxy-6-phosphogalactonate aldolase [Deltaproteobacteria bacterium]
MNRPSLEEALEELPLVAILRGVQPSEAAAVATTLVDVGFRVVEVPLNSPAPLDSLRAMVEAVGSRAVVGAGTVLSAEDAREVARAGGSIVVAPNTNPVVGQACAEADVGWVPGVLTPTEAFAALEAGAQALKFFPAAAASPAALSALRTVLPTDARVLAVGGVAAADLDTWWAAGARGFGIGGALYRPGRNLDDLRQRALKLVDAARHLQEPGRAG